MDKNFINKYQPVIGLEIHIELKTKTKIFCNCSTTFGQKPNINTCPVCLGLPGSLPVLNKKVVDFSIMASIALNARISKYSKFDRKNYYYPDLTKNFQTSQYDLPISKEGYLYIDDKKIRINRIHIEEDAGKLIHLNNKNNNYCKIDYNRAGIPLLEIVTEPDINNSQEAKKFIEKLKLYITYIDVSNCKMEEGSMRCDVNVSIKPKKNIKLGVRTEIKNLNSLKSIEKSIDYEINRQIKEIEKGNKIIQETRTWNEEKEITVKMRTKENAQDYRYFPEPDLPPIFVKDLWIKKIKNNLLELPDSRKKRYLKKDKLSEYDVELLISKPYISDFYDILKNKGHKPKIIVNYLLGDYIRCLKKENLKLEINNFNVNSSNEILTLLKNKIISGKIAKKIIQEMIKTKKMPKKIVEEKKLIQITDEDSINNLIDEVLKNNKKAIDDFNNGKKEVIAFLIGQVMRISKGKANPSIANKILQEKIKNKR